MPPSKIYGTATNDSVWEVTIPGAEEEDVPKDKGLICLNIYFAWALRELLGEMAENGNASQLYNKRGGGAREEG